MKFWKIELLNAEIVGTKILVPPSMLDLIYFRMDIFLLNNLSKALFIFLWLAMC